MSRRLPALLAAVVAVLLLAAPAAAHDPNQGGHQTRIQLPDGWAPEGITKGRHHTAFVGSLADGAIARVNLKTGATSVLATGATGRVTVGIDYESRADRIWAAGGPTGEIRAYDARTGALLQTYPVTAGFLNDVVVTKRAVYVTDSYTQQLIVIPLLKNRSLPDPATVKTLPLSGDIAYASGFNANGIVATHDKLILVQSNTGKLFRVDPKTGATREINLGGASLTFGDGLELHGRTLYVVRNQLNQVAVIRLRNGARSGALVRTLTSSDLDTPTTLAFDRGRLWVVNARFNTPVTPTTDYWLTSLHR
jgi:streptogramin lyase